MGTVILAIGVVALAGAAVAAWLTGQQRHGLAVERVALQEQAKAQQADVERLKAEALLQGKNELEQLRRDVEQERRETRAELQQQQQRIDQQEAALQAQRASLTTETARLDSLSTALDARQAAIDAIEARQRAELERIGGLTAEDARQQLIQRVEDEAKQAGAARVRLIEEETKREADRRARQLLTAAIDRCAVDHVTESTVSVVPLPSDEVKGRIIGREGRNIRTFQQLTGVDLLIDDTPEAVVISGFDPVRRETARMALEALIDDGRIHPARIEEVIERAKADLEQVLFQAAEEAVFETGVQGLPGPMLEQLGRLKLRTSYNQNMLRHSIEVSLLAGVLAAETGGDEALARRAGLLHDIGKAVDADESGPHAELGESLARRLGESEAVCHCIAAHHYEVQPESLEAVLIHAADAISSARPGARRDSLESYVQRLERLETLAADFPGVERAFAIQAGREVRIVVRPEAVNDQQAMELAREIAARIEAELAYPGQIKITVIREQRAVEYAR